METLGQANHALFSGNFSFYLESHWQLNNVEVNVVQLQDLQGFLQRGTHQLWGVAGIPQLGRQEQALFWVPGGTVSILQLTPHLHTHPLVLLTEPVKHKCKDIVVYITARQR